MLRKSELSNVVVSSIFPELFVRERTVGLGGIEECDPAVDGDPKERDHLLLVRGRT